MEEIQETLKKLRNRKRGSPMIIKRRIMRIGFLFLPTQMMSPLGRFFAAFFPFFFFVDRRIGVLNE